MPAPSYLLEMARKLRPLQAAPKVWNYAKYRSLRRLPRISARRYTPQIASLLVTKRCNLHCSYCNVATMMSEARPTWRQYEATLEKVQRIFDSPLFANAVLVDLLGGEPLLAKDFDRIVAFLSRRGHLTNVSTNGVFLRDRVKALKQAGISRINISLYKETRAVLERDLEAINAIFPVHTSLVLLRSDVEQEPDAVLEATRFAKEAGCRSMRFFMYRAMGEAPDAREILPDDSPALLELRRRLDLSFPGFCIWPEPVRVGPVAKRCPQLWQRISCDAVGNLGICCGVEDLLQGPGSNLFDGSPDEVFNHPTLVQMRERLLDPASEPPDVCKGCNLLSDPGW